MVLNSGVMFTSGTYYLHVNYCITKKKGHNIYYHQNVLEYTFNVVALLLLLLLLQAKHYAMVPAPLRVASTKMESKNRKLQELKD